MPSVRAGRLRGDDERLLENHEAMVL